MEKNKLREIVGIAIGEASMCWSEIPNGVFDSTRASQIVDRIMEAFESSPENLETFEFLEGI